MAPSSFANFDNFSMHAGYHLTTLGSGILRNLSFMLAPHQWDSVQVLSCILDPLGRLSIAGNLHDDAS